MKHKVKITVLRREFYPDLADKYLADPNVGKCNLFEDGQDFIVGVKKLLENNERGVLRGSLG